jgi:hypothetical protein
MRKFVFEAARCPFCSDDRSIDWQALKDSERQLEHRKAENKDARAVHNRIDLPGCEQKSADGIVATILLLRIPESEYRPDHDDGSEKIRHQDMGRIKGWKTSRKALRCQGQYAVQRRKGPWCRKSGGGKQVVPGAGLHDAAVLSGLDDECSF